MGFLKSLLFVVCGAGLVVLGMGNMAPVDLYLLPEEVIGPTPALKGVPLAAVVLVSVLSGVVIGQFMEWVREYKYRRSAKDCGRELSKLRRELSKARERIETLDPDGDLPKVPAR